MDIIYVCEAIYPTAIQEHGPDIAVWLAIGISFVALIATITQAIIARQANKEAKQREHDNHSKSVHDHFWIREIIVPKCVIPSLETLHELDARTLEFNSFEDCYALHILDIFNRIRDNFELATSAYPSLGQALNELVDEVDDKINELYLSPSEEVVFNVQDVLTSIRNSLSKKIITTIRTDQLKE